VCRGRRRSFILEAPRQVLILILCLVLAPALGIPATALPGDPVRCTTREDAQFQRLFTECTDGSRAVSRYDAQLKRWRSRITKPGPGEKPRGWDRPPVVRR
jgi:hypothetical protein